MKTFVRARQAARLLLAALAVVVFCAGCSSYTTTMPYQRDSQTDAANCAELLQAARGYVQSGQTGDGKLDWTLDVMASSCDAEYDEFVDEVSGAKEYRSQLESSPPPASSGPAGSILWSDARNYVGSTKYVCGPLVNSGVSGDDVFFNLGKGYPDTGRFTIVIWDIGGVEKIAPGTTLCVTGKITTYNGVVEIQVRSTSAVEVWR